jgi:hypothetical protein
MYDGLRPMEQHSCNLAFEELMDDNYIDFRSPLYDTQEESKIQTVFSKAASTVLLPRRYLTRILKMIVGTSSFCIRVVNFDGGEGVTL